MAKKPGPANSANLNINSSTDNRGKRFGGNPFGKRKQTKAQSFQTGAKLGGGDFNTQMVGPKGGAGPSEPATAPSEGTGTSIFDPVICEIACRWFCPPGGKVLDPFAGGSVRGIVASRLGLAYTGIELRSEQIAANVAQLAIAGRSGAAMDPGR